MKYINYKSLFIGFFLGLFFSFTFPGGSFRASEKDDAEEAFPLDNNWTVRISSTASKTEQFAAQEFVEYLERQSGLRLKIRHDDGSPGKCVLVGRTSLSKKQVFFDKSLKEGNDAFVIARRNESVILLGATDRGTLYAVYYLLERFGWRWPMPSFDFSRSLFQTKPTFKSFYLPTKDIYMTPVFVYRGGLIITSSWKQGPNCSENLMALIDWMCKLRLNAVGIHTKHLETVPKEIIEEIQKRDMRLVVEGHSWSYLGKEEMGCPESKIAMGLLVEKAVNFVRRHPEIDYFGPWSDDNTNWEFCDSEIGNSVFRASKFYNLLNFRLNNYKGKVRLIIPAYQQLLFPPETHFYPRESIVYLCPIDRDFGIPIYEMKSEKNAVYVRALEEWKNHGIGSDIIFYSYYRKHAWNSFPVNTPWLMSKEMKWLATQKIQGIWNYIVYDDWLSYDLQHYAYARLCWNPNQSVEALVADYCRLVGGDQNVPGLKKFHRSFEKIVLDLDGGGFFGYSVKGMRKVSKNKMRDLSIQIKRIDADIAAIDNNDAREIISIRRLWCIHVLKKLHAALCLKENKNKSAVDDYLKFLREPVRSGVVGKITSIN